MSHPPQSAREGIPRILDRYTEATGGNTEYAPRRTRRRYNGLDVTHWEGMVHVDDVEGYVENLRLKYYLREWQAKRNDAELTPSTEQIYEIMTEADKRETREARKPFHVARIADNIARNGMQEAIVIFCDGHGPAELWDGNRRFYGTQHIIRSGKYDSATTRRAEWLPAYVVTPSGSAVEDERIKHAIITELNFVEKDHIPWPAYVKAEQIALGYEKRIARDPDDPTLRRTVKAELAQEHGLKSWRVADRWIKMHALAQEFKEYHEEEHNRAEIEVDLMIQDKFEYFDELSKPGVWGTLQGDPDARDEVFDWMWDGKFQAFPDVRRIPQVMGDPVARRIANEPDEDSFRRAVETAIANDPTRTKDKEAANAKIRHFARWLDEFRREDYKKLDPGALDDLREILSDVVKILGGLQESNGDAE